MPLPVIGPGLGAFLGSMATNATNVALARSQNRFQERMSSSAHQRQAADLRKAGINPLLGAGGVGASSAVGTRAVMEDSVSKGIHSGLAATMQKKQLELLEAQVDTEGAKQSEHYARSQQIANELEHMLPHRVTQIKLDNEKAQKLMALVVKHASSEIEHNLASALQARSGATHYELQNILLKFQQQHFKNMSEAEKTWYMREIAPFIPSAKAALGMAANVATPFAIGRGAGLVARGMGARGGSSFGKVPRQGKAVFNSHRVFDSPDGLD